MIVEFPSADALQAFWGGAEDRRWAAIRRATGKWSMVKMMPRPAR